MKKRERRREKRPEKAEITERINTKNDVVYSRIERKDKGVTECQEKGCERRKGRNLILNCLKDWA